MVDLILMMQHTKVRIEFYGTFGRQCIRTRLGAMMAQHRSFREEFNKKLRNARMPAIPGNDSCAPLKLLKSSVGPCLANDPAPHGEHAGRGRKAIEGILHRWPGHGARRSY